MGAWKQFLASDIIVNPFVVNKSFTFTPGTSSGQFAYLGYTSSISGEIINSDAVGINRFLGVNTNYYTNSTLTGQLTSSLSGSVPAYLADFVQYNQGLVYNSIKQLYYTNFLSSSTGDNVAQPVLVPGFNASGNVLIGKVESPLYDNFLQSTLVPTRFWPTASGAEIGVVSIPSKIYGEYIVPTSFIFDYSSSFKAYDDGEGNLYSSASFTWVSSSLQEFFYSESVEFVSFNDASQITLDPSFPPAGYTFASASWQGAPNKTPFYLFTLPSSIPLQEIGNQGITLDPGSGVMISDNSVYEFVNPNPNTGPVELLFYSSSILNTSLSVSANQNVGNIIYPHGMVIFTNQNLPLSSITTLANTTCSFSSSLTIYEAQYKCTLRESEFNATLNPSAQTSGSLLTVNSSSFYQRGDGTLSNNVTGSYFSPYVTTVGLYDEAQNLLAIGKLAQPLPTSPTTDTTILVNIDK